MYNYFAKLLSEIWDDLLKYEIEKGITEAGISS